MKLVKIIAQMGGQETVEMMMKEGFGGILIKTEKKGQYEPNPRAAMPELWKKGMERKDEGNKKWIRWFQVMMEEEGGEDGMVNNSFTNDEFIIYDGNVFGEVDINVTAK